MFALGMAGILVRSTSYITVSCGGMIAKEPMMLAPVQADWLIDTHKPV